MTGIIAAPALPLVAVLILIAGCLIVMAWGRLLPRQGDWLVSFGLLKLIDATVGLRLAKDEEREGLDVVLHGEQAYSFGSAGVLATMREETRERPAAAPAHSASQAAEPTAR